MYTCIWIFLSGDIVGVFSNSLILREYTFIILLCLMIINHQLNNFNGRDWLRCMYCPAFVHELVVCIANKKKETVKSKVKY